MIGMISLLGGGRYREIDIVYNGDSIGKGTYGSLSLKKYLNIKDEAFFIIGIDTEETKETLKKYGINENQYLLTDEEKIFEETLIKINDLIEKGCKTIYLDFTHGKRSVGYGFIMAGLTMSILFRSIDIRLVYLDLEQGKNKGVYKEFGTVYSDFLEWLIRARDIVRNFNTLEMVKLKKDVNENLKGQENSRLRKEIFSKIGGVEKIIFNLSIGNVHKDFLDYISEWLNEKVKVDRKELLIIKIAKKEISEVIERLYSNKTSKRQLELGKLFIERGNIHLGFGLAREALVSLILEKNGHDPYTKDRREKEKELIHNKHSPLNDIQDIRNALEHPLADVQKYDIIKYKFGREDEDNRFIIKPDLRKIRRAIERIDKVYEKIMEGKST